MNPMMLSRDRHRVLVECLAQRTQSVAASTHFCLYGLKATADGRVAPEDLVVVHDFTPDRIDNNIGHYVASELLPLLITTYESQLVSATDYTWSEQEIFEHYVGEIVRSMDGNERRAWHLFYDNTLAALARTPEAGDVHQDFIADFSAIYRRTIQLIDEMPRSVRQPLRVLDVATCFGFFPLLVARQSSTKPSVNIVGCDLNSALVSLANDYARFKRVQSVTFMVADILASDIQAVLAPAPAFDVVTAIHLLEHLEPRQTQQAIDNLWKITARRLIIAVPLEEIPDPRFGHRQTFDQKRLTAMGRKLGGRCRSFESHGAWIVIDRTSNQKPSTEERTRYA